MCAASAECDSRPLGLRVTAADTVSGAPQIYQPYSLIIRLHMVVRLQHEICHVGAF